jgi:hypothetical protein
MPYTPSIFQHSMWAPVSSEHNWGKSAEAEEKSTQPSTPFNSETASLDQIRAKIQELQSVIDNRVERYQQMGEMNSLLHECHMERVSYMHELSSERIKAENRARLQEGKLLQQLRNQPRTREEDYKLFELEKKFLRVEQARREKREQKHRLRQEKLAEKEKRRQEKREQKRLEREAELLRYAEEQRERIRQQARLFREMKRAEAEEQKRREIADGWKVVTHKRPNHKNHSNQRR